ncbi:putative zinc-binding metallopeptidase, partial [Thiocapsa sp.]|uniref:putative zinc-binding metallopeptidase n=1 Tax=Thiocapsa sp. TaxID=2024551 RepID=UPI0025F6BE82
MKTFVCQSCGQPVFFENTRCTRCGAGLGFLPDQMRLSALVDAGDGIWTAAPSSPSTRARPPGFFARLFRKRPPASNSAPCATRHYRKCLNYTEHDVCNWMVPADDPAVLCIACAPNRTVPNLGRPGNLEKWARIERGKRRLAYGLLRLGLPVETRQQNPEQGLAFD